MIKRGLILLMLYVCLTSVVHAGARTRVEVLAPQIRTPGTYSFASRTISGSATILGLHIDRTTMQTNALQKVIVTGEVSSDGGVTWEPFGAEFPGGALFVPCAPKPCTPNVPRLDGWIEIPILPGMTKLLRGTLEVVGSRNVNTKLEILYFVP